MATRAYVVCTERVAESLAGWRSGCGDVAASAIEHLTVGSTVRPVCDGFFSEKQNNPPCKPAVFLAHPF
jgi:hypothetical protein